MFWLWIVGFIASVLGVTGIANYIHKTSNSHLPDIDKGVMNTSSAQQTYTESALHNAKNDHFGGIGGGGN
ncbi:hypothetical protein [Peribacillus deserti]|uniref:Uncharacterized protein n=1 Tax=Peribacillus deserti TaxID=673318 RepID=A0A2N5M129_9BACI|nr:hypothetical protein [Peribacillus deserti]PLT28059.1 hypothetical protein CUU66_20615 [Peribacillus deserti]